MTDFPLPSDEELLASDAWVRGVVRSLVRDPHLADDLAQEAAEARIRADRSGAVPQPRSWLRGVVRNKWRQHLRTQARRESVEGRVPRARHSPAAAELVSRAEILAIVGQAVRELPEPHRSVLLLRYHEGWPLRRIAAAKGVPTKTVDNQVQRGLRMLRPRLEKRLGDQWMAAVLPLAFPLPFGPGLATAIVMKKKLAPLLILLFVAAVSVIIGYWPEGVRDVPPGPGKGAFGARADGALDVADEPLTLDVDRTDVIVDVSPSGFRILRVVDEEGAPVEDAVVLCATPSARGHFASDTHCETAGEPGTFLVPGPESVGLLRVTAAGHAWTEVHGFPASGEVVLPTIEQRLRIRVVDAERGGPVEGVVVSLLPPANVASGSTGGVSVVEAMAERATSDGQGQATLTMPVFFGGDPPILLVEAEGWVTTARDLHLPEVIGQDGFVEVPVWRLEPWMRWQVVDHDGNHVAGARIEPDSILLRPVATDAGGFAAMSFAWAHELHGVLEDRRAYCSQVTVSKGDGLRFVFREVVMEAGKTAARLPLPDPTPIHCLIDGVEGKGWSVATYAVRGFRQDQLFDFDREHSEQASWVPVIAGEARIASGVRGENTVVLLRSPAGQVVDWERVPEGGQPVQLSGGPQATVTVVVPEGLVGTGGRLHLEALRTEIRGHPNEYETAVSDVRVPLDSRVVSARLDRHLYRVRAVFPGWGFTVEESLDLRDRGASLDLPDMEVASIAIDGSEQWRRQASLWIVHVGQGRFQARAVASPYGTISIGVPARGGFEWEYRWSTGATWFPTTFISGGRASGDGIPDTITIPTGTLKVQAGPQALATPTASLQLRDRDRWNTVRPGLGELFTTGIVLPEGTHRVRLYDHESGSEEQIDVEIRSGHVTRVSLDFDR